MFMMIDFQPAQLEDMACYTSRNRYLSPVACRLSFVLLFLFEYSILTFTRQACVTKLSILGPFWVTYGIRAANEPFGTPMRIVFGSLSYPMFRKGDSGEVQRYVYHLINAAAYNVLCRLFKAIYRFASILGRRTGPSWTDLMLTSAHHVAFRECP